MLTKPWVYKEKISKLEKTKNCIMISELPNTYSWDPKNKKMKKIQQDMTSKQDTWLFQVTMNVLEQLTENTISQGTYKSVKYALL